jgi:hypothetical protein
MSKTVVVDLEEQVLDSAFLSMTDRAGIDEATLKRLAELRSQGKLADKALLLIALGEASGDGGAEDRPDRSQGVSGHQEPDPPDP